MSSVGSRRRMLLVQGLECFLLHWKAGFRSWMRPIHRCQVVVLVSIEPSQLWWMAGVPPKLLRLVPGSCSNSASSTNFWISGSAGGTTAVGSRVGCSTAGDSAGKASTSSSSNSKTRSSTSSFSSSTERGGVSCAFSRDRDDSPGPAVISSVKTSDISSSGSREISN